MGAAAIAIGLAVLLFGAYRFAVQGARKRIRGVMPIKLAAAGFACVAVGAGLSHGLRGGQLPLSQDPSVGSAPTSAPRPQATATPAPSVANTPVTGATRGHGAPVFYPDCAVVFALGKAPLYSDQPGFRPELDEDHDGIACN